MAVRVAINGFGRIGRLTLRAAYEAKRGDVEVVAVNDLGPIATNVHLLKYDTTHGKFPVEVQPTKTGMTIGNHNIEVLAERDPSKLPWAKMGIDVVMECTGLFTKREDAEKHRTAGAKKVLISAPATGDDLTVVYGVNDDKLLASHTVVSNASCTTNCLGPVAYVLHNAIGIEKGYMTTVHSYTGDQSLLDVMHKDLRRARAAARSIIPTSTGAARAVGKVLPELNGKIDGTAVRVPTENVSMIDFKFLAKRNTTAEEVNDAIRKAAATARLKGILIVNEEELVSHDFNHNPASSIFDATETQIVDGNLVRVLAWYDNEWGFSNRMVDTTVKMGGMG